MKQHDSWFLRPGMLFGEPGRGEVGIEDSVKDMKSKRK